MYPIFQLCPLSYPARVNAAKLLIEVESFDVSVIVQVTECDVMFRCITGQLYISLCIQ